MRLRFWGAIALLSATACATGQQSGGEAQLDVAVINNLIPPATLTIYLVPHSGIEYNLGNVIGSGTQHLQYRGLSLKGEYQLVARPSGNRAIFSNIVVLDHVRAIAWDLQRNYIEIVAVDEQ